MMVRDDMDVKDGGREEDRNAGDAIKQNRKGAAKRRDGEIDCWRRHVDTIEVGGVKQEIISVSALTKKKNNSWYMGNDSFMLDNGSYAYRDCNYDVKEKPLFYRVLTIEDDELERFIRGMHAMDREEGKSYRAYCLHQDYGYENYKRRLEEEGNDGEWTDPIDSEEFLSAAEGTDDDKSRPFPRRSVYAVIRTLIKRMTPADRVVYEMLFESYYTEAEIKSILGLGDSAWTNRKNRFLERVKRIFVRLRYDVDMQRGYELPPDDIEDDLDRINEDLEEKKGDFGEDEDDVYDEYAGDAEGSADKKKAGNWKDRIAEDLWRREIQNDMRQENRRSNWM